MPWTYILECSDGTYYVGSTIDLERRLNQHQTGEGAAYTRSRLPVRLAWSGWFDSIRDAFYFEKQVQGWGRAKRLALIEGRWEDLPALARTARPAHPSQVSTSSTTDAPDTAPHEVSTSSTTDATGSTTNDR